MNIRFLSNKFIKSKKDAGSTLVTVVVVIAFMSILATIMLYISGQNYKTKIIDQRSKASFYEAEEVIELMRTRLIMDVIAASEPAFSDTSVNYIQSGDESIRSNMYLVFFKEELDDVWHDNWYPVEGGGLNQQAGVEHYFPGADEINVTGNTVKFKINLTGDEDDELECVLYDFDFDNCYVSPASVYGVVNGKLYDKKTHTEVTGDSKLKTASRFYVNNIKLMVTDKNNYTSVIQTSFEITPPMLNWGIDAKNPDDEIDYMECVAYYEWRKE
ncbi:MAG: type II secretion system GspH family protein [Lachnospiraceae bacterium]|nr:type II secretion system GspH family protein [Lachnospiraceae bacterium]